MTICEILQKIEENRDRIREFGVGRIGVFGSASRGEALSDSDLDILVELEKETFRAYMGLKFFLEELFDRRVDLVLVDTIKPRFRESILSEVKYAEGL